MPRRYRRTTRRPYQSRRRRTRLAYRSRRRIRTSFRRPKVYRFKRSTTYGDIAGAIINAPYLGSRQFSLDDIPNRSEFSNLFDQYKISLIVLKIKLLNTPDAQGVQFNQSTYPTFGWVIDRDDAGTPGSIAELQSYSTYREKVLSATRYIRIAIRPSKLLTVYNGALGSTYMPTYKGMLDMSQTSTPHYGIKYCIDNLQNTNFVVKTHADFYFSCRETR